MYYGIIRWIICAFLVVIYMLTRRLHQLDKIFSKWLCICACVVVCFLIWMIPFENLFIVFPTAEAAHSYAYQGEVTKTIEGDNSTLVLSDDNGEEKFNILPRKQDGWLLPFAFDIKLSNCFHSEETTIVLIQHRRTKDSYLYLWSRIPGDHTITDTRESDYCIINKSKTRSTYCAYIGTQIQNFSIFIDQKEIELIE